MKLPNWFKIVWWLLLLTVLTAYLAQRYSDLRSGRSAPIDVVIFLVWFGILLVPLFNEINFFGLRLKQQVESLRRDVIEQVQTLKSEIQNTIQISPNITIAPPDAQLPKLEQEIRRVLDQKLREYGVPATPSAAGIVEDGQSTPDDVLFLFQVRYSIEKELRRIAVAASGTESKGSLGRLLDVLMRAEVLDYEMAKIVRQVYAVCSPAIHGEQVSANQVSFVREVAPELLAALKKLRETAEMPVGPLMSDPRKSATADT